MTVRMSSPLDRRRFLGTSAPAGALGPVFGPQLKYVSAPERGQVNPPPSDGLQFFGHVRIDGRTGTMTVTL